MDAVTTATSFVVLLGALAFVGWPLANPSMAEADTTAREKRREALDDEKERLLDALGDLDHDRRTGKMEEGDFDTLTAKLKVDAAKVLRDIDVNEGRKTLKAGETPPEAAADDETWRAEQVKPEPVAKQAEKPVQPPTAGKLAVGLAEGAFCTKCGRRAKSIEDRFCGKCGAALPDDVVN